LKLINNDEAVQLIAIVALEEINPSKEPSDASA
jgi:hypothetical protein